MSTKHFLIINVLRHLILATEIYKTYLLIFIKVRLRPQYYFTPHQAQFTNI